MYDYDYSNESDCSFDYSDYEYNTLEPYTYELSNFKVEIEETPEDKLLKYIQATDILEIKALMPSLMLLDVKSEHLCNGEDNSNKNNVSENGDVGSEHSDEEFSDYEEDKKCNDTSQSKYKEIILKNGDTPLMAACTEANSELISYFLSLGYDVNYKLPNSNKTALLSLFCKINSNMWGHDRDRDSIGQLLSCLQVIIEAGGDVRAKCFLSTPEYGNTALHYAVQNNYWELIETLINAGADVDAVNNQKSTPLQIAASKGYVCCCNILLLAGANAKLVDKSGNTAADIAELDGHNHLSDAINVYCGNAQHNVRLYKIWRQYASNFKSTDHDTSFTEIVDTSAHNHSCIESFCLALNAPYLAKLMEDQGISISDLKFMDELKLQELGVPEIDCKSVISAMKDLNRKAKPSSKKVNFSYGKPLKPITMLEMIGNIGEHTEFIETNLESMLCHLSRNEKFYMDKYQIINKCTVDNLKSRGKICMDSATGLMRESDHLNRIINQQLNQDANGDCVSVAEPPVPTGDSSKEDISPGSPFVKISVVVTSLVTISLGIAFLSKRYLFK